MRVAPWTRGADRPQRLKFQTRASPKEVTVKEHEVERKTYNEHYRRYRDQMVTPSPEILKARLAPFQLDPSHIAAIPPLTVCDLDRTLRLHSNRRFEPEIVQVEQYVHSVSPVSLDHLKELVGVPNRVHEYRVRMKEPCSCTSSRAVRMHDLPQQGGFRFDRLPPEARVAVRDLSYNLVYGWVDADQTKRPPYAAVADYVLERVKKLPVFIGNDLVVCPDQTVSFSGFAAVYFTNVLVVGTGKIFLGDHTKLHAHQIKHI